MVETATALATLKAEVAGLETQLRDHRQATEERIASLSGLVSKKIGGTVGGAGRKLEGMQLVMDQLAEQEQNGTGGTPPNGLPNRLRRLR